MQPADAGFDVMVFSEKINQMLYAVCWRVVIIANALTIEKRRPMM
jgi:hypothetical protein